MCHNLCVCSGQVYPDLGVAQMLKNQWQNATFRISSLGNRRAFEDDDELIVIAAPDPQGGLRLQCSWGYIHSI